MGKTDNCWVAFQSMIGLIRSAQLIVTLLVVAPMGLMGLFNLYTGHVTLGILFLGFAAIAVGLSEYVYGRLVTSTVDRAKRLGGVPDRLRNFRD